MKKYLDKIRSLINNTVDRYGYDKALHFLVAAVPEGEMHGSGIQH